MTTAFQKAFQHTVGIEGAYSNNPADPGGATKFGITERVARSHGYQGDMRDLPLEFAEQVYKASYWDLIHLDLVAVMSKSIAAELFDTAVNCGVKFAAESFQRTLNAFNREQKDYADITVDGLVGPATLHSLRAFLVFRGTEGEHVFLTALNVLQGAYYINIVERRPTSETFLYGWFKHRVKV